MKIVIEQADCAGDVVRMELERGSSDENIWVGLFNGPMKLSIIVKRRDLIDALKAV